MMGPMLIISQRELANPVDLFSTVIKKSQFHFVKKRTESFADPSGWFPHLVHHTTFYLTRIYYLPDKEGAVYIRQLHTPSKK